MEKGVEPGRYKRVIRGPEGPVLTIAARWPRPEQEGRGWRRMGRYYDRLARRWLERWEGPVLARAQATGATGWTAELDFTPTYEGEGLWSLYLDVAEQLGERTRRLRLGDVWETARGTPVPLPALLGDRRRWRQRAVEQVKGQIERRLASGEYLYHEDYPRLCRQHFSPERYYLTAEGPVVFYLPETIAPALEGIPCFLLEAPNRPE